MLKPREFTSIGDYTYSIEKVNVKTDLLTGNEMFVEMDEQGNYIFEDPLANKYYKVNEKECLLISNEETLKFKNTASPKYIYVSGYDVFESQQLYYTDFGYVKTSDTEIDPNKQYWKVNSVNSDGQFVGFSSVQYPDISEIDTYYEEIYFRYPTSTEIDNNTVYYKRDEITGVFVKVDNPVSEDINKYRIKIDNRDSSHTDTKIATLDSAIFEEIFSNYYPWDVYKDEATNKLNIIVTNGYDTAIYTSDGTLVEEFKGIEAPEIIWYSNSFLAVKEEQGSFKIMDKDTNIIFESETLPLLYEIKYENNVMYLTCFNNNDGKFEFYNMYESKIANDNTNDFVGLLVVSAVSIFATTKFKEKAK